MISLEDMHSENMWFSWSKPSNYREKLRYHACDGGMEEERGTAIIAISTVKLYMFSFDLMNMKMAIKGNRSIMCQLASSCWFLAYLNTGRQSLAAF